MILYPLAGLFAAAQAMQVIFTLRVQGTNPGHQPAPISFSKFNDPIGVEAKYDLAERFGAE